MDECWVMGGFRVPITKTKRASHGAKRKLGAGMRGAITQLSKRQAPKLLVLPVLAVALAVPVTLALAARGHLRHEALRGHVTGTEVRHGHDGWEAGTDIWKGRKVG